MRRLGAGRASQVFDLGDGRVLRRGGCPEREATVMAEARAAGYPVPNVLEVRDEELVLELVEGPTMLADLRRRPWRLRTHARLLATLHEQLHAIPWEGQSLVHLDLHPDNVLLARTGPVVIDWTNARGGHPALDLALTWTICSTSGGRPGRVFARSFAAVAGRETIRRALPEAAALRAADPNVTGAERDAIQKLLR